MSYILEALRKSEKERRRGTIPDPLAVQEPLPSENKSRTVRSYLIVATLLLSTLISGLWFGVWYAKKTPEHRDGMNQTVHELQVHNLPQSVPEIKEEHQHTLNKDMTHAEKLPQEMPDSQERGKRREHLVQKGDETRHDIMRTSPGGTMSAPEAEEEIPPPDKNKLYSLHELPASLRQKFPDFSFSVFLYADEPDSRMVRVNGVTMKEGQFVTTGLRLEEIIPDGVIFSYRNYRFRVRIQ